MTRAQRVFLTLLVMSIAVPLLLSSTMIATRLRWSGYAVPDAPLMKNFWNPLLTLTWWGDWHNEWGEWRDPDVGRLFLQGVMLAFGPIVLAVGCLGYRWWQGNLPLLDDTPVRVSEAGSIAELKTYGGVASKGPGVVIGKHGSEILRVQGDGHVWVDGASGSGKGTGVVVPTLLTHHGSMLVHDPKHSLARITHRHRASLGPVKVFDPTDRYSTHFNPLLMLRPGDDLHGDCEMLGTLMALSGETRDPVWESAAGHLMTALLLVAFEHDQPTLTYVHDILMGVCANEYPTTAIRFVQQVFKAHQADHHKITSSVNFTMRDRMKFASNPVTQAVTEDSGMDPRDLFCGDNPTTVYVTVPPPDRQRMELLMRLVMQTIMNAGLYLPTHVSDGREKTRDVMLMFDEFPTLRRLAFLETNIAECREYGIRCVLVSQSLGQIRDAYGQDEAITTNCSTKVLMPGFSDTLEEIARWGGETVRKHHSSGRQMMRPLSGWSSDMESLQPALNTREMIVRARSQMLVLRDRCLPTYVDRANYLTEPTMEGLWDA
jgi:type IV secretion system protein VirD4